MEHGLDTNDVSIWFMQNNVTMTGVYGSYHGNLQHVGNITKDLVVTLRDNEEQSDSVQTACMSRGKVADIDADSSARAHREYASVEQVKHCTINSDNGQPTCYPQLVDCATQTETRTFVDRLWTGLGYISRFLYPILAQIIKIGQHIHRLMKK
ncbi:hypothetical protein DPMN_103841 [Dreissena polymorpha]|uniref:Uncharacterized protein n=2 Tax=Dreissena polymorpha TaxID=45954 RepID=A0A9D4H6N8_DREPO|nr:hypothetical protein DPMN_103841 [Dreissena polymorpha]